MTELSTILFVTIDDSANPSSGLSGYYLREALSTRYRVVTVGPLSRPILPTLFLGARKVLMQGVRGVEYPVGVEHSILQAYSRQIADEVRRHNAKLVFSNLSHLLPSKDCDVPFVFLSDATVWGLEELGGYFDGWSRSSIERIRAWDRYAIERASAAFYMSEWAAQSAIANTSVDPARVKVVPPGANWVHTDLAERKTAMRTNGQCRLLFYGRDWERKGGPFAVETLGVMRALGARATLTICGPTSKPGGIESEEAIEFLPPVTKDTVEGATRFVAMCENADYHILPTKADCTPIAVAELAQFGVPTIISDVGGASTMVDHGKSGYVMSRGASPKDYALALLSNFGDESARYAMRANARRMFEDKLNWSAAIESMVPVIDQLLESVTRRKG